MKIVIACILLFANSFFAFGQKKGAFTELVTINNKEATLYYYVPEDYSPDKNYPLIIGLSYNSSMGKNIPAQMNPVAKALKAVFVCPDYTESYWDNALLRNTIDRTKQNYKIDDSKVVLTGYVHGAKVIFNWGMNNYREITGMIGYAADFSFFSMNKDLIKHIPIGLIAGSEDVWKEYPDKMAALYEENNGKCKYIVVDGVDQMGPYYTSQDFVDDMLECYNFIINNKPNSVSDDKMEENVQIMPNPLVNESTILLKRLEGNVRITLFNCLGEELETVFSGYNREEFLQLKIDRGKKVTGIYFLEVQRDNSLSLYKIAIIG